MQQNSNEIRDRMLRSAAKMWGGNEVISEPSFDPLVGMLMSACAFELENISREIEETRLRVAEKIIDMMVPDVNSGVLAAHALATATTGEGETLATPEDSFYASGDYFDQKPAKPIMFSPAGFFKLVNGSISGMFHAGGYYEIGQNNSKSEYINVSSKAAPEPGTLWLAFDLPPNLSELENLSVYFNCRKSSFRQNFYYLLRNAIWTGNEKIIDSSAGFSKKLNEEDFLFKIFGKRSIRHNAHLNHIRKFYDERFITIDLRKEHLRPGIPAQFKDLFAKLPAKEFDQVSSHTWVKLKFPQNIHYELFDDITCSINTFPVTNLSKVSKIFKSRKHLNLFALKDEDAFFDLESVEDSDGNLFLESKSEKITDIQENFYVLRSSGVESFDARKASEHITYLLEKLKNESASFSFLDKTAFNGDLLSLSQIIARLELNQENLPDFSNTFYLYLNTKKSNLSIFVDYFITSGDYANGLKPGTVLNLVKGSQFSQASIKLATSSIGGRSKMTREDRVNTFKKALLTRDKIVSEEDLKSFCTVHFGKYLEAVSVRKGVQKVNSSKESYERTIDLYIDFNSHEILSENDVHFLCKDFLVTLEKKSSNVFPYRLFIDNNLIEV